MTCADKRLRLALCLLALNLSFIWGNSLLPGEISGAFSDWVKDVLCSLLPGSGSGGAGGGLLRKIAHFMEFCTLGMCLGWIAKLLRRPWYFALAGGVLAACVDETIQLFVPDRGPSILDVGIDTCGVIIGIALLSCGCYIAQCNNKFKE